MFPLPQFDRVWYYYIYNGDIGNATYPDYLTNAPVSEIIEFLEVGRADCSMCWAICDRYRGRLPRGSGTHLLT